MKTGRRNSKEQLWDSDRKPVKIRVHIVECLDKCFKPDEVSAEVAAQHNVRMD